MEYIKRSSCLLTHKCLLRYFNFESSFKLWWCRASNPTVVTGICDLSKSWARHHHSINVCVFTICVQPRWWSCQTARQRRSILSEQTFLENVSFFDCVTSNSLLEVFATFQYYHLCGLKYSVELGVYLQDVPVSIHNFRYVW